MYRNYFSEKSEDELRLLYKQYLEWLESGSLGDNELGEIRDKYFEMGLSAPLTIIELDLLREVAKYWYKGATN